MREPSEGLMVAFIFILILSMGIGNILRGFADLVDRRIEFGTHWSPLSWLILALLIHLGLFWTTLEILKFEEWKFASFLYITTGPIILFLATGIILPKPTSEIAANPQEHYFQVSRLLFSLLALLMIWSIGGDFILERGFKVSSLWNLSTLPILLLLCVSRKASIHAVCTILFGVLLLSFYIPLGFGALS